LKIIGVKYVEKDRKKAPESLSLGSCTELKRRRSLDER